MRRPSLPARLLRLAAALAVAVPLGPGGLCCCLVKGHDAPPVVAAAPESSGASPCCQAKDAEPPSPARSPVPDDDCGCPQRENVVLASASAELAPVAPVMHAALLPPATAPVALADPGAVASLRTGAPAPVPKLPLFRTLGVLLC